MIDTSNKPLMLLVALNIVALVAIFWLVSVVILREEPARTVHAVQPPTPQATVITTSSEPLADVAAAQTTPMTETSPEPVRPDPTPIKAPAQDEIVASDTAIDGNIFDEPVAEETVEPVIVETVRNIDVYYDGSIIRMEETDNHGRRHTMISTSLKDVDRIAPQDAAYLSALRDLKAGRRSHVSMTSVTREMADEVIVTEPSNVTNEQEMDYFNKVDVSASTNQPADDDPRPNLAARISALVSQPQEVTEGENSEYAEASLTDYLDTLDVASDERANEMRTIKVKRGDSLWLIARRAYGSGFSYPRIFEANPHIKNPDMIREGDILRVPL